MAEVTLNVKLMAHTQLTKEFADELEFARSMVFSADDGEVIALTAIRTCYSHQQPSEIVFREGEKYFGAEATDGKGGTDADRLLRHIVNSKHTSTLEHITFTFAIEGVSRALLAQLTRHRHFSFSVQSQRYVRLGSDDKSGGFDYVVPQSVRESTSHTGLIDRATAESVYHEAMRDFQELYDILRTNAVPPEDARLVLPNATATNLVMTANLRSLLEFYEKRKPGSGAQWEIAELAKGLRDAVAKVEPWTAQFFGGGADANNSTVPTRN